MPQVFKIAGYWVYFWSDEGKPREPIHVHISKGSPSANATKIWITSNGKCILEHNKSKVPEALLSNIIRMIENRYFEIMTKWKDTFGEIKFYC